MPQPAQGLLELNMNKMAVRPTDRREHPQRGRPRWALQGAECSHAGAVPVAKHPAALLVTTCPAGLVRHMSAQAATMVAAQPLHHASCAAQRWLLPAGVANTFAPPPLSLPRQLYTPVPEFCALATYILWPPLDDLSRPPPARVGALAAQHTQGTPLHSPTHRLGCASTASHNLCCPVQPCRTPLAQDHTSLTKI
jgi:hypothetical protein